MLEDVINDKQKEIEQKNEEIEKLTGIIDENTDKLKTRMKIMYEYGNSSYLELVLEAKGLSDFFSRVSVVKDIVSHDKELINTYVNAKNEVELAKSVVEQEKNEQVEAKSILENKKGQLVTLQNKKDAIIKSLNSDITSLEAQEKKAEEDYNSLKSELNKALAAAQAAAKSSSSSTTPAYVGNGKFIWPSAASTRVTSEFGKRNKPNAKATSVHRGIRHRSSLGKQCSCSRGGNCINCGI